MPDPPVITPFPATPRATPPTLRATCRTISRAAARGHPGPGSAGAYINGVRNRRSASS